MYLVSIRDGLYDMTTDSFCLRSRHGLFRLINVVYGIRDKFYDMLTDSFYVRSRQVL